MHRYTVGEVIGRGSFGEVFLVNRKKDQLDYVMKKMSIIGLSDKERESYETEVQLLSELEFPGIVSYLESFVDFESKTLCIIMAYCEGGDLTSHLKSLGDSRMAEPEVLYHFVQMALSLHYMHSKNILHRDLKTQNVFMKNGLMLLGDFGISKVLDGKSGFAQTCIGTPYYMSPELFKNKPYGYKSDIWALGCCLYELATLHHAFEAQSINGLAGKIMKGEYPPIHPTYSQNLRLLIKSMLLVSPEKRPSIAEILCKPFVQKKIRKFVVTVILNQRDYREVDLTNLKKQLKKLGMSSLWHDAEAVVRRAKSKNAGGSMRQKQGQELERRWKEHRNVLEQEMYNKDRLEHALRRLETEHQKKLRHLGDQRLARHRGRDQGSEDDMDRHLDEIDQRKRRFLTATQRTGKSRRHLDAKRRRENREAALKAHRDERRRTEKVREDKQKRGELRRTVELDELEQGSSHPSHRRTKKKSRERRRSSQDPGRLLDAKMEGEKGDLGRIREEREWLERRVTMMDAELACWDDPDMGDQHTDDEERKEWLSPARKTTRLPSAFDAKLAYRGSKYGRVNREKGDLKADHKGDHHDKRDRDRGMSITESSKNKVLAEKERRREEQESAHAARLEEARHEYGRLRARAGQRQVNMYHSRSAQASMELSSSDQPSEYGSSSQRVPGDLLVAPFGDLHCSDSDNEYAFEEEEEDTKQMEREILLLRSALTEHNTSLQNIRNSANITKRQIDLQIAADDDDEFDFSDDEEVANPLPSITANSREDDANRRQEVDLEAISEYPSGRLNERMRSLTTECIRLLGRRMFKEAYGYLKNLSQQDQGELDNGDEILSALTKILGQDKLKHWKLLDQLIFIEDNLG